MIKRILVFINALTKALFWAIFLMVDTGLYPEKYKKCDMVAGAFISIFGLVIFFFCPILIVKIEGKEMINQAFLIGTIFYLMVGFIASFFARTIWETDRLL